VLLTPGWAWKISRRFFLKVCLEDEAAGDGRDGQE